MRNNNSFKNFSYVAVGRIAAVILQAIFYLLFAALLEPESYGELNYLIALASTVALLSRFGLNFTVTIYQAKENSQISNQINTLAIISTTIASIFLLFINEFAALFCLSVSFFMMYHGNLLGLKKYKSFMFNSILRTGLIIIIPLLLYFVLDIPGIILGMAISNFISCLPFFRIIKISSFLHLKNYTKIIIHNFGVDASTGLSSTLDKLLVAPLFGFLIVGIYQFNFQIMLILGVLPTILYSFLLSEESSGESHKKITLLAVTISVVIAVLAFTFSPMLVNQFFPKYSEGIFSLQIIVLSVVPLTLSSYFNAILQARGSTRIGFSGVIRIVVLLLLLAWLGEFYGLLGLSLAVLFSIIANVIFLYFLYIKTKK